MIKPLSVVPALLLSLAIAGCSQPPPRSSQTQESSVTQAGVPGGVITTKSEVSARVTDKDDTKRRLTLMNADGKEQSFLIPKEAVNFEHVKIGDLLVISTIQQITAAVLDANAPIAQGEAAIIALAEKGAPPGGTLLSAAQIRGKIIEINPVRRTATMLTDDGATRLIPVRPDIDLTKYKVGDQIVIKIVESIDVRIEKP